MLRNVDPTDSEVSRTLAPKQLPNGSENNVPEVKKPVPFFREGVNRGRFDLGKALLGDNSKITEFDEMPRLESSPLLDGLDGVPASPEMPTLVPFAVDSEDAKTGLETHLSKNGYYRLNKENVNLSDPESPHLKNMSGVSSSPLTPSSVNLKRKRGRPKRRSKLFLTPERATTDKRFQPVVLLKRLVVDQESVETHSRDSSNDSWSQWPEEYEGCSYDDYVCEAEAVESFPEVDLIDGVEFLSFLQEGDVKEFALKDKQTIVFPSESSCTDMESCPDGTCSVKDDHAFIVPTKTRDITQIKGWKRKIFFDDNFASSTPSSVSPSLMESEGGDREDESSQDALQSSPCPSRSSPSDSRSSSSTPVQRNGSPAVSKTFDSVSDDDEPIQAETFSENFEKKGTDTYSEDEDFNTFERSFQDSLRLPGTPPESYDMSDEDEEEGADKGRNRDEDMNTITVMGNEKPKKNSELENDKIVQQHYEAEPFEEEKVDDAEETEQRESLDEDNVLLLGEQPDLYGTAKTSAFASRSLDDFLGKHSSLDISFLKQCNPIVDFIPSTHPVLSVGCLKIDEETRKNKRPMFAPIPSRYSQVKPNIRTIIPKKSSTKIHRVTMNSKIIKEKVIRNRSPLKIINESITVSLPSKEHKTHKETAESRISFHEEESNMSAKSVGSRHSDSCWIGRPSTPDFSQDSNERREIYSDNALLFESNDVREQDKAEEAENANFYIDHYEPVTVDEAALAESRKKQIEVIRETVWSVKDTIREERLMYDLLCELKSPDSYLISKIKFGEESPPEVDELLTEDDANEIAKSVYLGYSSKEEMVQEVTALEEAKKARHAKSVQLAREKKRKKEAQLKTVKTFVQWRREVSKQSEKEETITRKTLGSQNYPDGPFTSRTQSNYKRRRIRPPSRFLDGAPLSDDEILSKDSEKLDKSYVVKRPTVRPHSAALPLVFENSEAPAKPTSPGVAEASGNASTAILSIFTTNSSSLDVSSKPLTPSSPQTSVESDNALSPASATGSIDVIETFTDSEGEQSESLSSSRLNADIPATESVSHSPSASTPSELDCDFEALPQENITSTRVADSGTQNEELATSEISSINNTISLRTSPENPKLMRLNVTVPVVDKILDMIDESARKPNPTTTTKATTKSNTITSDSSCLGIVLNNGVHTITPKNSNHIERIKMNLNSTVNIGSEARMAIRKTKPPAKGPLSKNVLHLTPLNEYQWKPTGCNRAPIIKSFLIDTPQRNNDVLNMPLAAVAQPVTGTKFPNENVYLLYGSLDNLLSPAQENQEKGASGGFKGLTVRVGKQELLLSCSLSLAKAPVRLNALIGKVVTPLLLYPALKTKGQQPVSQVPFTVQPLPLVKKVTKAKDSTSRSTSVKTSCPRSPPARTLQFPQPVVPILPATSVQDSTSLQNLKTQHFRIMTKDNKLTVESMPATTVTSPVRNLTPVTQLPRTTLVTGNSRTLTQLNTIRFPRPGMTVLETTLPSASGPRKVLVLPRAKGMPASILRNVNPTNTQVTGTLVTSALYQTLTGGITRPMSFTTAGVLQQQQIMGVPQCTAPQMVATSEGQYLYVQSTTSTVSTQSVQRSQTSVLSPIGQENKDNQVLQAVEQSSDPSIPVNAQEEASCDVPKGNETSDPGFQITDVRTCSPPIFDQESNVNGPSDQAEAPSNRPAVVDIASDEENDSLWISGEGETCFVMRLPDEDEDEPHVVACS